MYTRGKRGWSRVQTQNRTTPERKSLLPGQKDASVPVRDPIIEKSCPLADTVLHVDLRGLVSRERRREPVREKALLNVLFPFVCVEVVFLFVAAAKEKSSGPNGLCSWGEVTEERKRDSEMGERENVSWMSVQAAVQMSTHTHTHTQREKT
jgi:hypothetical protein